MTWDSEAFRTARDAKLREWLLGNEDAVLINVQVSHIAEVWDDLKDGDGLPTEKQIAHAFESAMIHLQTNPLYLANHAMLTGFVIVAINAWHDANALQESADRDERMQAFFLRNLGIEITMLLAFIVGGYNHMRAISAEVRAYFRHETFDGWEKAHAAKP